MKTIEVITDGNCYYESNRDMFMCIVNMIQTNLNWNRTIKKNVYLMKWIDDSLPLLRDKMFTIQTKVFWIITGITEFPRCANPNCNHVFDDRNVRSIRKGYVRFCTSKCGLNSPQVKDKAKNTCIQKYGTTSPAQNDEVKAKGRKTCMKKYGVEYSFQSENNKEKSKLTLKSNYGVEHPAQCKQIMQKIDLTKKTKYGENQPWHSPESMEKRKETWKKNLGVDHPMKSDKIKKKYEKTSVKKYGVSHFSQSKQFRKSRLILSYEKIILNNEFDEPVFSVDEYINRTGQNQKFKFRCKTCNTVFEAAHHDGCHSRCPICYPIETTSSLEEKEVAQFIESLGVSIVRNDRSQLSPLELDINIPNKKIAIEFDGLYWHSFQVKNSKTYHIEKTNSCNKIGIQLIHIFENEWVYKKDIVKSRIKNLLGIYDNIVYARSCEVKIVDSHMSKDFQEKNHIQGAIGSSINYGLFYKGEMVSLMTFGKSRFNKRFQWELLRFCNKIGFHIPGAASKLLKHFERDNDPQSLISYADKRWSQGNVYSKLGFTYSHTSKPSYWYFLPNEIHLMPRNDFQKHTLKNKLKKFDESLSEQQNMMMNGYYFIYDCGNEVFVKTY